MKIKTGKQRQKVTTKWLTVTVVMVITMMLIISTTMIKAKKLSFKTNGDTLSQLE